MGKTWLVRDLAEKTKRKEYFLVFLSFSMLGIVTGYLTGFSREPAVGAVLPAVLSLMGGLLVFMVGKDASNRKILCSSMFLFSLMLLIGSGWGSVMRDKAVYFLETRAAAAEALKKSELYLKQQAFIESQVNEFRKNLDLPPLSQVKK